MIKQNNSVHFKPEKMQLTKLVTKYKDCEHVQGLSLQEYLGLSEEEHELWLTSPNSIKYIFEKRQR